MINILTLSGTITSILMFIVKFVLLMLVLGIIILVHEFGHFIWAKKFGVHIYEFSIGMGPLLFTHKGKKDNIDYNIRAIPIGGYVSMAGEVYDDAEEEISKDKLMCNKPWYQRLIVLVAGVVNNFILAIILLSFYALVWQGGAIAPKVQEVVADTPAAKTNLKAGDTIVKINGYKVRNWDRAQIILYYKTKSKTYTFDVKHSNGKYETIKIVPEEIKDDETGATRKVFGIAIANENTSNIFKAIGYGFRKFGSIMSSMTATIGGLITKKISLKELSGPVGIYQIVGESVKLKLGMAISYIVYITAFLSINVGYINILPFPAFDGGHVFFILVEKIKGSPVNAKFENTCHLIGFALIFLLMIIVTINDIIKLF